jgi:DNA modification methylase
MNAVETTILLGDSLFGLQDIHSDAVQCCVTSPPYFALRDYGCPGQIGLEATPDLYIAQLVEVFREVRRVLRNDGTLWLNIGDSYVSAGSGRQGVTGQRSDREFTAAVPKKTGAKNKDLLGIPWLLAFALRADGWFLRSDIVWEKPNAKPESVRDRPTSSYEHVFLLSKRPRYFYDPSALEEPIKEARQIRLAKEAAKNGASSSPGSNTRSGRDVWRIATTPLSEAHFATMPLALADRCIRAGSKIGDLVLDPFLGAGTTSLAANRAGRHAVGCELNKEYANIATRRLAAEGYISNSFGSEPAECIAA